MTYPYIYIYIGLYYDSRSNVYPIVDESYDNKVSLFYFK